MVRVLNLLESRLQTRQVTVQRWSINSTKPFESVVAAVEGALGRPNMTEFAAKMGAATTYEEMKEIVQDSHWQEVKDPRLLDVLRRVSPQNSSGTD
jgi:hypothetical protein